MDMYKICTMLENELSRISDKGLTTANIEVMYKLIDMYKDIKNVEYWDSKMEGYSNTYGGDYSGNDSYGRHYVRGHYSRDGYSRAYDNDSSMANYDRYMDEKRRYRSNKSSDCKERVMESLNDYMDSFVQKMESMADEADCAEERQTIEKYINKIKQVR